MTATKLPIPGAPNTIYIVDLHCFVWRFYATTRGRAATSFIEFLSRIIEQQRPSHMAVCADLPHPTFRHALAPKTYKAQRKPAEATLLERLRWSKEMVEDVLGLPVKSLKGYEADDLIASIATRAKAAGMNVVVLALDKDLMQLVDDKCCLWDGKYLASGPPEVEAKFGVRVDQLRDYLAIVGDAADNVPGIRLAGPHAAIEILKAFGTLEAALEAAKGSRTSHPFFWESRARWHRILREQREQALLSQKLVTLAYDVPLDYDLKDFLLPKKGASDDAELA
jgi:DNA polymerase-1